MVLPPQGRESLNRLIIRGTEVVSSNRVLRNIERFEAKRPLIVVCSDVISLPPLSVNIFGFCPVYKAEEYDFATGTWTDVTANYDWNLLTDLKGTEVAISTTGGVDRRFRVYIDLLGSWIYISAIMFCVRKINALSEFVVEASSYSNFSADVSTHLNWTGNVSSWDAHFYFWLDSDSNKRYIRITFTIRRDTDGDICIKQILGLSRAPPGILFERHYPFSWDKNRNIYPVADNSKDLGTSSRRWRDLWVGRDVHSGSIYPNADNTYDIGSSTLRWANVYAVNVITGDIGFEELSCPVCGQQFKVNDSIVLKVRKVDSDKILCIPVHTTCNPHELPEEEITEPPQEDKRLEIIPNPSFEITAIEPADENRMYIQAKFEDGIVVWITADIEASEDEITEKLKEAYVNEKRRIIEDEERKRKGAEKLKMIKERLIGMKKKVEIKADEIKRAEAV